ncbi:MAG: pstB9 [Francisellaceae bacterium]|nr:pstB9 [Francisellaceae bacterium]
MENFYLKLDQVSFHYGEKPIVKSINLNLEINKPLLLIGANGTGKSTTLKLLAGLIQPTHGSIFINQSIYSLVYEDFKSQIGYLPEKLPLYPELTVKEYLEFIASLRKKYKAISSTVIQNWIERFELGNNQQQSIKTLSLGTQQRLGLIQALIHEPKLLLLDEPTAHLDPYQAQILINYLKEIKSNSIILISTHQIEMMTTLSLHALLYSKNQPQPSLQTLNSPVSIQDPNLFSETIFTTSNSTGEAKAIL